MSFSDKSYFGKIIIFLILSIAIFLVIKFILPERLFPEHSVDGENIVMDSLALDAQNDSMSTFIDSVRIDSVVVEDPSLNADGYINLRRFYEKLYQLEQTKSGKVRIGYFGDSMNDGDYIVQDVREAYQEKYGGEGVGFVSISTLSAGSRASISHQSSTNWYSQAFINVKRPVRPFGIDGQVYFARYSGQSYWVRYRARSQPHSPTLNNPTLFYGSARNSKGYVTIKSDLDSLVSKSLVPQNMLNTMALVPDTKYLQVNFQSADSIPIYGFNFDNGEGVHVDNFSYRGNSGLPLSILNPDLMNEFDKVLNYDLIILHYGANVLGYKSKNFSWYGNNMTAAVNNLKACFPNADILVLSTADRAIKLNGYMQTDPAVIPLAKAQKEYAKNTNSGFISLYDLMGGNGSMIQWVKDRQAGKDYTHFNTTGSKKIAYMIYDEIEKGYEKYKANR